MRFLPTVPRRATLLAVTLVLITARGIEARIADDWTAQVERGNTLVERGNLTEAETVYAGALASAEREGDELRAGVVLLNLGRLLDRKGQLLSAEKAYLRAIHAFRRVPGSDERLAVRAHVGLVAVYLQTEQHSRAETLIHRVLADSPAGAPADIASLQGTGADRRTAAAGEFLGERERGVHTLLRFF